jgi:hypothetical protein
MPFASAKAYASSGAIAQLHIQDGSLAFNGPDLVVPCSFTVKGIVGPDRFPFSRSLSPYRVDSNYSGGSLPAKPLLDVKSDKPNSLRSSISQRRVYFDS